MNWAVDCSSQVSSARSSRRQQARGRRGRLWRPGSVPCSQAAVRPNRGRHASKPLIWNRPALPRASQSARCRRMCTMTSARSACVCSDSPLGWYPSARETPSEAWLSCHTEVIAARACRGPKASASTAPRICCRNRGPAPAGPGKRRYQPCAGRESRCPPVPGRR